MVEKLIQFLEEEKWYPEHPTAHEIQVSHHLNRILDDIVNRIKRDFEEQESLTDKITQQK